MEFRGTGRKIYDGSEAGVPYLHGEVVRKDFAEKYPEIVIAFLKAVITAGKWVEEDPVRAAESLEKWTGVEKEVQYLYFSKGGHLTLDPTIKPQWVDTLKADHGVLARERQIPPLDFSAWISDRYIRQAYAELGLDYQQQTAVVVDPKERNRTLPPELWRPVSGLKSYPGTAELLKAAAELTATGQKINATYVYDQATGLKLLGKVAFYVQGREGGFTSFLRRRDAEAEALKAGTTVLAYADALAAAEAGRPVRVLTGGTAALTHRRPTTRIAAPDVCSGPHHSVRELSLMCFSMKQISNSVKKIPNRSASNYGKDNDI